jgi:ubiquinone/menaquinone biosynthesis C-methylase UbiE
MMARTQTYDVARGDPLNVDERERKLVERYDAHAAVYQKLWAPTLRLASVRLLPLLSGANIRRAVDVGAGVGSVWADLRTLFPSAQLLGLDRSAGMLRIAPQEMRRVIGDARALPLSAASMDLALLVFMLFHLPDPIEGIREARRVVKPGGFVGTITWGSGLSSPATRIWTECLDQHGAEPPDPVLEARDEPLNTPEKMGALLRTGGFESVRAWSEPLVTVIGLEHLLELKTRMGGEKARFDSLDESAQQSCTASARQRLETLSPADFTATGQIIYAVAS